MEKKVTLGLPDKLEIFHRGSSLAMVRKWFGWRVVCTAAFTLFWWNVSPGTQEPALIDAALLHVVVGIGLTYYVVAGWLNRTYILVKRDKITVRHAPLPWVGNKELESSMLKQLYAIETYYNNYVTCAIHAITQQGRDIALIRNLTREQALYIEQEVEEYLGIEDLPVKGEIGR